MHKYRYIYPNQQQTGNVSNKAAGNFYFPILVLQVTFLLFIANCLNWLNALYCYGETVSLQVEPGTSDTVS